MQTLKLNLFACAVPLKTDITYFYQARQKRILKMLGGKWLHWQKQVTTVLLVCVNKYV
jgi:hypothetical protein